MSQGQGWLLWWMKEYTLDLRMLQDSIPSAPCYEMNACENDLSNHGCVTILSVETDESYLWCENEMRQVGHNDLER
jgi:hypothetical protein